MRGELHRGLSSKKAKEIDDRYYEIAHDGKSEARPTFNSKILGLSRKPTDAITTS